MEKVSTELSHRNWVLGRSWKLADHDETSAYLLMGSSSGLLTTYMLPSATSPPSLPNDLPQPNHTLIEHRQNLCSMDSSDAGLIATGSWDK